MASYEKRGNGWRVFVCVNRKRASKTFATKREATAWAIDQEADGILARHTLREAIERYRPIAEAHKGWQAELSRLKTFESAKFIDTPLELITPAVLAFWRDERLQTMAPVSVRREIIIMSSLFKVAIREWGWMRTNPLATVKKPGTSKPRQRGISQDEIDAICANLSKARTGAQVTAMFLLSIETGLRLSELVSLKWEDVTEKSLTLYDTKNGDARSVPLSMSARSVINQRKGIDPKKVFTLSPHVVSQAFRRATVNGVHFHDARSEAITRLSKRLNVMQLAKMIGHRDLKSLMHYYAESAEEIADRL